MAHLKLIKNELSDKERIEARIEAFRREFMRGEGDMQQVQQVLDIILDYLCQYDEPEISQAFVSLQEGYFWLDAFMQIE